MDYQDLLEVINGFQIERAERILDILEKNILGEIWPLKQLPVLPPQGELPEAEEDLPPGSHLTFPRNYAFTGRVPDLQAIAATLFYPIPGAARRMALTGGGGTGKTQLAVEFCYRYGRFTYGVHWLDATQPIESQIVACGAEMKLPGWENLKLPEQVEQTLEVWQAQPERLVLLDNLDEPSQLGNWLDVIKEHPLLVTSRKDDYEAETGVNAHRVLTLHRKESRELLRKLARRLEDVNDDVLDPLCDRLGDLPLALDLAGRYLAKEGIDIPDYLEELEEVETILDHESFISDELNRTTAHVRSLAATFHYSWKYLQTEEEYDALARRSFLACGYCAANISIPEDLLLAILELEGKSGQRKLKRSLNRLYRLGLLAESGSGPVIHPLLAEFARLQDAAAPESALPALVEALAAVSRSADDLGAVAGYLPLLPHLQQVGDYYRGPYPEQAALMDSWLGLLLQDMGDYPAARPYLEQALAIYREVLGEKHPDTAQSLNNLGSLLQDMGDYPAARPYLEQALAICRDVLGEKHPVTAASLNNLGMLLQAMGDYPAARPYLEQALAILESNLGPDHPNTQIVRGNLASLPNLDNTLSGNPIKKLLRRFFSSVESSRSGKSGI